MVGICCDYTQLRQLPQHPALEGQPRIGFFPGSLWATSHPKRPCSSLPTPDSYSQEGRCCWGWINRAIPL